MSDLPRQGLLQQLNAHPHSGEYLEVLGKRAAARYGNGDCASLTDAVVRTVKEAQLSPEQVKRVVEFTNTAAYLTDFKKEGMHHIIDFVGGPADAAAVIQDLNDGGGGSVFDRGTLDYKTPPSVKIASAEDGDSFLKQAFDVTDEAPPVPYAEPLAEAIELKDKLASAKEHLHSQLSGLEVMFADVGDRLYHQVKQASLGGTSLGQVASAWNVLERGDDYIKAAFALITPRLLTDEVFHSVDEMSSSVDKLASDTSLVNEEHPLIVNFQDFCDILHKLAETRAARDEVAEHLGTISSYIKQASLVGGVLRGAERAGAAAHPLLNSLAGQTAADVGSAAIKYSPYVAGALGASELHAHLQNSPSLPARLARGTAHKVLQAVPGTQEHLMHKYEIQNGQ